MKDPRRLLIRAPSWLGDFVMAEPVYRAAQERFDRVTLAAPARMLELLRESHAGLELVPLDGNDHVTWRGQDVALFLDGSLRSVWSAVRAGIPERVAWGTSLRTLLATCAPTPAREAGRVALGSNHAGRFPRRLPRPFTSAAIELAGFAGIPVADRTPRLSASTAARDRVQARLRESGIDGPFELVNLGGVQESAKSPPEALWREWLEGRATERGEMPRVFVCGPGEEEGARALADLGTLFVDPVCDLAELVALAERAAFALTPDSGPRHLFQALGLPLTVLFGSTDPRHTAEDLRRTKSFRGRADCAPCHLARCSFSDHRERSCHPHFVPDSVESSPAPTSATSPPTTILR